MVFHVTCVSGCMRCLEEFLGVTAVAETTHLFVDKLLSIIICIFSFVISHDESMSPNYKWLCVSWDPCSLAILIHPWISKLPPLERGPLFTFPMRFPWRKSQQARVVPVGFKNLKCCCPVRGHTLRKESRIWRVIGDRLVVNEDRLWMLEQVRFVGGRGRFSGRGAHVEKCSVPSRCWFQGCETEEISEHVWDIQGTHLT